MLLIFNTDTDKIIFVIKEIIVIHNCEAKNEWGEGELEFQENLLGLIILL